MKPNKKQYSVGSKLKPTSSITSTDSAKTKVPTTSRLIKKSARILGQSTLDSWKREKAEKPSSILRVHSQKNIVDPPKRNLRRQPNVKVESSFDEEDKINIVASSESSGDTKLNKAKSQQFDKFVCEYCNLRFSSSVWMKKHIEQSHLKKEKQQQKTSNVVVNMPEIKTMVNEKTSVLNFKQKLNEQQNELKQINQKQARQAVAAKKTLATNIAKSSKNKRVKISPKKTLLREQLKQQLEEQRKLLKVQQEVFEKANKTQNDIYELLAKLGDDDNDDEDDDEDVDDSNQDNDDDEMEDEVEDVFNENESDANIYKKIGSSKEIPRKPIKRNAARFTKGETKPTRSQETYYLQEDPNEENCAEYLISTDGFVVKDTQDIEMSENYILLNDIRNDSGNSATNDQNVIVHLRTDDGLEEYELIDVDYEEVSTLKGGDEEEIDFEIVCNDDNAVHCRIVSAEPQNVEYTLETEKVPLKVDVSKISSIAQNRLQMKDGQKSAEKADKLLNQSMNKSAKQMNDYIQEIVQKAAPTDDNKFECPMCQELVSNRYSLGPHILRLHSKQKNKICPHCDRAFTCTGDLTRHIRIHTGDKPFKCTFENCTYAFRASGDLHKHLRRHNSSTINIRQYVCEICDRAFERNYDLKRHFLTHKKNEEGVGYDCEFCSKRFVRKDQHKAHVFRHLGIKPYQCPDCGRSFGDFSNCSKHIKQCQAGDVAEESNEISQQFTCEICLKRFKSKTGFQQHTIKCEKLTKLQKALQESIQQDSSAEED